MKLKVKSNGNVVEMKKENYDKLPQDQKLGYTILSKVDAPVKKDEPVKNEAPKKIDPPATGDKEPVEEPVEDKKPAKPGSNKP